MPVSLSELVEAVLPSFAERGQRSFYRSMLRAEVMKIDKVTPKRTFKDRDEWKALLDAMQKANIFTYSPETDTITLPAADAAEPKDAADE